jgi:hypothetical protein
MLSEPNMKNRVSPLSFTDYFTEIDNTVQIQNDEHLRRLRGDEQNEIDKN